MNTKNKQKLKQQKHLAEDVKILCERANKPADIIVKGKMKIPRKDFVPLYESSRSVKQNILFFIRNVPEFAFDPTFVVANSKDLIFASKHFTITIKPAVIGLSADNLKIGQTVRVSFIILGITASTYTKKVKKLMQPAKLKRPAFVESFPKRAFKKQMKGTRSRINPLKKINTKTLLPLLRGFTTRDIGNYDFEFVNISFNHIAACSRHHLFFVDYKDAHIELEVNTSLPTPWLIDKEGVLMSGRYPDVDTMKNVQCFSDANKIATVDLASFYCCLVKAKIVSKLVGYEPFVLLIKNIDGSLGVVAKSFGVVAKSLIHSDVKLHSAIINVQRGHTPIAFINLNYMLQLVKAHMKIGDKEIEMYTNACDDTFNHRITTKGKIAIGAIMPVLIEESHGYNSHYAEFLNGREREVC